MNGGEVMTLKYPEKVFARMIRISTEATPILLRQDTSIQFGDSTRVLGFVIMTNPGSFSIKENRDWFNFLKGDTTYNIFEGYDKPDLTMQNIIKLIRDTYLRKGVKPNGLVRILNISTVVESRKEFVEEKHQRAMEAIMNGSQYNHNILMDPLVNNELEFVKACHNVDFIVMGFADQVFVKQVRKLINWLDNPVLRDKVIFAKDDKGRLSHPRRWRTEPYLMEKAINRLAEVIKIESEVPTTFRGYTLLKWNEEYGSEAKFIVRDNKSGKQSIFIPGREQDVVWLSLDLANLAELVDWTEFGNEFVESLEDVLM